VPQTTRLTPEAVQKELKRALRKGAQASRLVRFSQSLVDLLVPAHLGGPEIAIHDRAIAAEQLIREGISAIGGASGEALTNILCLKPGTLDLTLEQRRQAAGALLGMEGETFRRDRHEGLLIWDLAMSVYGAFRTSTKMREPDDPTT